MSALQQPCRRCRATSAWLLRPVRERRIHGDIQPMRVDADGGWYEAIVCVGCGHTDFFAHDFRPQRAPVLAAACRGCGGRAAWDVSTAPDLVDGATVAPLLVWIDGWFGAVAVRICCGCGGTTWSCRPDRQRPTDDAGEAGPPCGRCRGAQWIGRMRDETERLTEDRAIALRHGWLSIATRGTFLAHVCKRCHALEWHGARLEELVADEPNGVYRIDRKAGGSDGPYR